MFGSDHENCWNTLNYDETCIWNSGTTTDIPNNTSFTISQDSTDSSWKLTEQSAPIWNFLDASWDYRTNFTVYIDSDWFYTQSSTATSTQPLFTREIQIQYLEQDNSPALDSNAPKMQVKSIVQWLDSSWNTPHNVTLTTELTNWKK